MYPIISKKIFKKKKVVKKKSCENCLQRHRQKNFKFIRLDITT